MKRIHKKFTQKQLKDLIKIGSAVDITGKEKAIKESYTQIGYSMGNIGVTQSQCSLTNREKGIKHRLLYK